MRPIKESALLKTSAISDVVSSGGVLTITGLKPVNKKNIVSVTQVKYKAEVAQVITFGSSSYTPVGGTTYSVSIFDPNRDVNGFTENQKKYLYTTTASLVTEGATAALQREYIHAKLVTAINADTTNRAVALSLGTGTGVTITDDGGYYPVKSQTMTNILGANQVILTGGFASTDIAITTAAVYAVGVGATLASMAPVVDAMYGNLVSGSLDEAPKATDGTFATAGQKYDVFVINSLHAVAAHNVSGQLAYVPRTQYVWVDNGTGSAVTNLAGFIAFEKEMHKLIAYVYSADPASVIEFFDRDFTIQGPLGAVPVTTTSLVNKFITPYGLLSHTNVGTQTIVAPTQGTTGLLTDQDVATGDGAEYYPPIVTPNSQQFVVGKQECMLVVGFSMTAVTGANTLFGFRKKEAFQLDYNNYNDLAAIGTTSTSGKFSTAGILANAATLTTTSTTTGAANAVRSQYIVKVDILGAVTCYANGVSYPIYSAGTTPMVFAAGTTLVPFFLTTQITGTASVGVADEFLAIASKEAIS
jgi:hypothetical protein